MSELVDIAARLCRRVAGLRFAEPVTHVYNPLEYAWEAHRLYLERWAAPPRDVVLLGMNPGPWGMAQTGVPFGEVGLVRDWLGIEAPIGRPRREHPKRPIDGFACRRSEVSGRRLWGWARDRFGSPERFFARFLVMNYCPLVFMEEGGRNRTPDRLPSHERQPLLEACDAALQELVAAVRPRHLVGVGRFAARRAAAALAGRDVLITGMLHPSPASPLANRGWSARAERDLAQAGIELGR